MPTIPFRATPSPLPDCSIIDTMTYALNMTNNTAQFDVTGHPSMSLPCGMGDGRPIGLMLTAKHYDEATIYQAAHAFEQAGDWTQM